MKRVLLIVLSFFCLIGFGQFSTIPKYNGTIPIYNNTIPVKVDTIIYDWNDNDTLLFLMSSSIKNTDTLDASAGIFTTYVERTDGPFTVHPDSGVRGYDNTFYSLLDTKEYPASQLVFEPFGHYRIEYKIFLKDSFNLENNRIMDMGGLGFFDITTLGSTDNRFTTDRKLIQHTRPVYFSANTWANYYQDRDFETGDWLINGTLFEDGPDTGMYPINSATFRFLNRSGLSRSYIGWLDSLTVYSLGETSTAVYNCKSDSSIIFKNPQKRSGNVTISHPANDVIKFTGGANNGYLSVAEIQVNTRWPSYYDALSPECLWVDIKQEGTESYSRFGFWDRDAPVGYSDTIRGTAVWDYYQLNMNELVFGIREKRYGFYLPYAKPMPGNKLTFKLKIFLAEGESISIRNFGLRYKSDVEITTNYLAGNYQIIDLGTPNITASVIGDLQGDTETRVSTHVIPIIDSASDNSDVGIPVGDIVDFDTIVFDTTASVLLTYFGIGNFITAIGNHDTYWAVLYGKGGKFYYKRFLDDTGQDYYVDTVEGHEVVRQVIYFGNDLYVVSDDNLRDDCNDCGTYVFGTPWDWTLSIVDSISQVNPNAVVVVARHFPLMQHEASSIFDGGQTAEDADSVRSILSQHPNFYGFVYGHRHQYGMSVEENGIVGMLVPSMAKSTGSPIFVGYIEVFDDWIRWSYINHNDADLSEVTANETYFPLGFTGNHFGIYDDWMSIVQPRNREIYDTSIGLIRD